MPDSFKCPMCAAPLEYDGSSVTVHCPYCTNTVIVPDDIRGGGAAPTGADPGPAGSFGQAIDHALRLAEVAALVKTGNKIQAIALYRQIFNVGLADAKAAVEGMESGQPLIFQQATAGGPGGQSGQGTHAAAIVKIKQLLRDGDKIGAIKVFRECFGVGLKEAKDAVDDIETGRPIAFAETASGPQVVRAAELTQKLGTGTPAKVAKGCGAGVAVVLIFVAVIFGIVGLVVYKSVKLAARTRRSLITNGRLTDSSFAHEVMAFGEEGVGAGQFKDARSIAVDGAGHIYVGEYQGGRVLVFDAQGKFLSQFNGDPKAVLLALAADRNGTVYLVHPSRIVRYRGATGEELGEVPNLNGNIREFFSAAAVALDGSLYAIGSNSEIVHITPAGKVTTAVQVHQQSGEETDLDQLAVDGAGNLYGLDGRAETILKFGPDGKFLTRFGGHGSGQGQFSSPNALAVDGQGRVFVGDSGRPVQVFDASGRWVGFFGPEHMVVFALTFAASNQILVCSRNEHRVIKYQIDQ